MIRSFFCKGVVFMRIDLIVILSFLLERGYVKSFRVTQDKIYVTIKK